MSFTAFDHECMAHALRLARRGINTTHPNPRVGCVIAADGRIIAGGWHRAAGEPHAEIRALQEAGARARGATVYVTLEPCSHQGRTPPCVEALIEARVGEVVVAAGDPNPRVDGGGIARLAAAGIDCRRGLMEAAAEELNAGFVSRMRRGRPWLRLKLAQSLDGRTALADGTSQWITGEAARLDVQSWRARASVTLTGIGTVLHDDPSLNVRLEGAERQPGRVIVDSRWRTPATARMLGLPGLTIIAGLEGVEVPAPLRDSGARLVPLPERGGRVDLGALMRELARLEVNEVHAETGGILSAAFLEQRLVDELLIYQAPCLLGADARPGVALPSPDAMQLRPAFRWLELRMVGDDLRIRLQPQYPEV